MRYAAKISAGFCQSLGNSLFFTLGFIQPTGDLPTDDELVNTAASLSGVEVKEEEELSEEEEGTAAYEPLVKFSQVYSALDVCRTFLEQVCFRTLVTPHSKTSLTFDIVIVDCFPAARSVTGLVSSADDAVLSRTKHCLASILHYLILPTSLCKLFALTYRASLSFLHSSSSILNTSYRCRSRSGWWCRGRSSKA